MNALTTQLLAVLVACCLCGVATLIVPRLWHRRRTAQSLLAVAIGAIAGLTAITLCVTAKELPRLFASKPHEPVDTRASSLVDDVTRFARDGVVSDRLRRFESRPFILSADELRHVVAMLTNGPYADRAAIFFQPIADLVISHVGAGAMHFDEGVELLFRLEPCRLDIAPEFHRTQPLTQLEIVVVPQPARVERWARGDRPNPYSARSKSWWNVRIDSIDLRDAASPRVAGGAITLGVETALPAPDESALGGMRRAVISLHSEPVHALLQKAEKVEVDVTWTLEIHNGKAPIATRARRSTLSLDTTTRAGEPAVAFDFALAGGHLPTIEFHRCGDRIVDGRSVPSWEAEVVGTMPPRVVESDTLGDLQLLVDGEEIAQLHSGLDVLESCPGDARFNLPTSWPGTTPPSRVTLRFLPRSIDPRVPNDSPPIELGSVEPFCRQRLDRWWDGAEWR